ncbi:sensor domain-containing diguanylate cyclase [Azospirillum brasilense]|uniref:sensor domain-containing diguanylate cyclase n=1 Tax=Azospirillum brasilense TaxID=192 RepID=UPI001EDA41CE|nr:sensor domain-containing diguanylate cyclase [Azospirillum brasilense]UKJ73577.1 sensor domain-containing diguanylate cyclase [Azospirillum brasilense]
MSEVPPANPSGVILTPTLLAAFPGPAIRLDSAHAVAAANAAADELLSAGGRWLADIQGWLATCSVAPGLRSLPVELPRGVMIVEWAATPLPDGEILLLGRDATLERQLRQTLIESRRRYKDLVEVSSDFAWETGSDGRFVFVTPKGALGYSSDALIGRNPKDLAVTEWGDLPLPFDSRRPVDQAELWLKRVDDLPACFVVSAVPLFGPQGEWMGARGVCRETTEQVLRSAELARVRNREKMLAHIVHTLRDQLDAQKALHVAAVETARALGADGCRIYRATETGALRPAADFAAEIPEELLSDLSRPVLEEIAGSEDPHELTLGANRLLAARTEHRQAVNGAVVIWRGDDSDPWDDEDRMLLSGVADHIGIAHAHLAYQERLRRLSERDGLTGLFNRRTFFERLDEVLGRSDTGPSALLYVDLDNFKAVNDLHGHQQGDAVLKAIGGLLTNGVRPGDLPGRLGGDEFVLWLGRTDEEQAVAVAERLLAGMVALRHLSAGPDKPLGLSIGVAVHRVGRETVQELTDRADSAMYDAKKRGKGHYAVAPAPKGESSVVAEASL